MQLNMLKGKIHRATVTQAELDYVGSITIDQDLLDASGIREYEKVQVADVDNGVICLNGAAAHLVNVGDKVIIMCYCQMTPEEASEHAPHVVFVDENNAPARITRYERHGRLEDMA